MKIQKRRAAKDANAEKAANLPARANKTAKAEVKTPAEPKPKAASKYRGVTSGLRVMEYQDTTFAANTKAMLTDEELAADWHREFPQAVAFEAFHVKGARRDYNRGVHSTAFRAQKPTVPLAEVIVVEGKRRFITDVKAEAAEPASEATPKTKGRVRKQAAA